MLGSSALRGPVSGSLFLCAAAPVSSLGVASVAGRVLGAPVWELDFALGEMAAMSEAT